MEGELENEVTQTHEPVSEDDWIIHSVNIQGVFFERLCRKIIEEESLWQIGSKNLPVEFPPPTEHSRGRESNLDIRAEIRWTSGSDGGVRIFTLPVECKKNNPEFVKWLFFTEHAGGASKRKDSSTDQVYIRQTNVWSHANKASTWIAFPRLLRKSLPVKVEVADEAREVRGSYRGYKDRNSKTRTANSAISEAAYQVALATQALFYSESQFLDSKLRQVGALPKYDLMKSLPWVAQVFLPLIVTTARLFICDSDPQDIDLISGEIPYSKARISEQPYLLYEYALPRHLQATPKFPESEKEQGNLELFSRMHIMVVNSAHFGPLLKIMSRDVDPLFW